MINKNLFIWVEGPTDKRFFEEIVEPRLKKKYHLIETRSYATLKAEKINNFLKAIKAMNADYLYVTDINNSPCVTDKKQNVQRKLKNIEENNIIVVIKEIESWYLAGLDDASRLKFKIPHFQNTDIVTKEQFNRLKPNRFESQIDFMIEILKNFSPEIAKKKNSSFNFFFKKFDLANDSN